MGAVECITKKVATGLLNKDQGKEVLDLIDAYQGQNVTAMSPAMSQVVAGQQALGKLKATKAQQQYQKAMTLMAVFNTERRIIDDHVDRINGFRALFDRDVGDRGVQNNFTYRKQQVFQEAGSYMGKVLKDFEPKLTRTFSDGARHTRATDAEINAELFGNSSGNQHARELAEAFRRTSTYMNSRWRAGGGLIGELKDYDLPHIHNVDEIIRRDDKQGWTDFVMGRLDRDRMVDLVNGQKLNDDQLRRLLDKVYDNITGKTAFDEVRVGAKSLGNSREQNRMLHFSEQGWLEYNTEYKGADYFTTMLKHLDEMSHDIAHLEMFGPNSKLTFDNMKRIVRDGYAGKRDPLRHDIEMDRYIGNVTGTALKVGNRGVAQSFSSVRKVLASAQLGSAALLAVPGDLVTAKLASSYGKLPYTQFIGNYARLIAGDSNAKQIATEVGLLSEFYMGRLHGSQRFMEGELAHQFATRLADLNMGLSGLNRHTDAAREAFGLSYAMKIAQNRGKSYDRLDVADRRFLDTYGIRPEEWNAIKDNLPVEDLHGTPVFNMIDLAKLPGQERVARAIHQGVLTESGMAVIGSGMRTDVRAQMGTHKGTLSGEIAASMMMYKRFPIQLINTHVRRMMQSTRMTGTDRLSYVTQFVVGMMAYGALAVQMREIAKGNEPMPMDTPMFWAKAFVTSGVGTVVTDLVDAGFNFQNLAEGKTDPRAFENLTRMVLGPVFGGIGSDVVRLGQRSAKAVISGKGKDAEALAGQTFADASRYIPLKNLWYTKLAMQRLLLDQAQKTIDPGFTERLRKQQREMNRRDQEYWWKPGDVSPSQ